MRGYIFIPKSISCTMCKHCGARPVIALVGRGEYVVKCPNSDSHYQTDAGLIDIEDWNRHNIMAIEEELEHASMIACYDSQLNYTLFLPV
ncbi:MAG: hypothetical protein JWP37_1314 [Mucilaginibacter sp.]|nr:hypothetical protein [Mucilaginibacter sp.]